MEDYEPEEPWSDPDLKWEREREEAEYDAACERALDLQRETGEKQPIPKRRK